MQITLNSKSKVAKKSVNLLKFFLKTSNVKMD